MFDSKWIADLITAARATLGVVMIWLGTNTGRTGSANRDPDDDPVLVG